MRPPRYALIHGRLIKTLMMNIKPLLIGSARVRASFVGMWGDPHVQHKGVRITVRFENHAHAHSPFTCPLGNESGTPFTHLQEARTSTLQPAKATAGTGKASQRDEGR